ncbi:MAG: menaquinone biosynthesis decarboxylase [Deferrisomatales bacterium]|nr:menaquinone biosynthesis decarboxylase [Deferrisomatales bacterium]
MAAFPSLREFVTALDRAGELRRVPDPLSPRLEIPALADLAMKAPGGGQALLFERPTGHGMPVLVNAFGSRRRLCIALGVEDVEEIPRRIEGLLSTAPPRGLGDALRLLPTLLELRGVPPRRHRGRAPCQEVVRTGDDVDLTRLPVLTCWPGDGGPFVTLPCVFTRDPETGRQNLGMYRLQVFDRRTTGMHWHVHKDGSRTHGLHRRSGQRMEVAVAIGTDPVVTYCATAPMPHGVDELLLAGFIRKKPVSLTRCVTVDLQVPATAEIVLEGYVDPGEERVEGPFGDHTGVYSPAEPYPVFHVTAVTHRRDPLYFATVVGIPPMEDEWLGYATERIFRPLLRTQWPEVREMHLPAEGVFHNLALLTLDKHYPMQARRLFQGLWGAGQMSFTKILAALDPDADVRDPRAACRALLDRARIPEGLVFCEGVLDALDHASPQALWGGKLGIDATGPLPGEPTQGSPEPPGGTVPGEEELLRELSGRFPGLKACRIPVPEARRGLALLVLEKSRVGEGAALAEAALETPGVDVSVAVEGTGGEDLRFLAWRALSSVDPCRDVRVLGRKIAVDATTKGPGEGHPRPWPPEVSHPPEARRAAEVAARRLGLLSQERAP